MAKARPPTTAEGTTVPVLFLVFNRPEVSSKVFDMIRLARPPRLYIAADGPRPEVHGEAEICEEVRRIATDVDWKCDVFSLFLREHLGCALAISNAIGWFFEHESEGIILEDDCLPSCSFFMFCQELLERYRDDKRVMHIAGTNLHFGKRYGDGSYYFSRYNLIWGWATWRRAWQLYDVDMNTLPSLRRRYDLERTLLSYNERISRMAMYDDAYSHRIDTWDYQWHYATRINSGLAVHPNVNLVQNLGFCNGATHTWSKDPKIIGNVAEDIDFPLVHPEFVLANRAADKDLYAQYYAGGFLSSVRIIPALIRDYIRYILHAGD